MQVNHHFRFNSDSRVYLEGGGLKELFLDESDAPCIKTLSCSSSVKTVVVLSGVVHSNYKFLLSYKEYYFFLVDGKCRIYHTDKGLVNECGLGMIWFHSGNEPYLICDTPNDGTITVSTIEGEVFGNFQHQGDSLFIQCYSIYGSPVDTAIVEQTFGFRPFGNIRVRIDRLDDDMLVLSKEGVTWDFYKY